MTPSKKPPKAPKKAPQIVPDPAPEDDAIFEAPPADDLEERAAAPEEIEPRGRFDDDAAEPQPLEHAGALVDAIDGMISEAGEPPLATWERALLIWSLDGLDVSLLDVAQPTRAIGGCAVIAGSRIAKRRRRAMQEQAEDEPTPAD